jgi:arylsulfatase A-like enzyme
MKRSFLSHLMMLMLWTLLAAAGASGSDRPNIVWLVTEDNSVHYLRLYSDGGAAMPNLERLAEAGIVFNNAFSNAPVCSSARSTIISGCFAPRLFAQHHRRAVPVPLPGGLRMFPWYLRQAGYYTTNNSKEDYNYIKGEGVWDDSSNRASYRNRGPGQPFFHVQNFGITHEGNLHFTREEMAKQPTVTDPDSVAVFPLHPDTPIFRYTSARYHDLHIQADDQIGTFIGQLEADGLMEETIIFYYGDHGGVLPGSKGYIYERGLHVPMVVYVPEKWRHLFPAGPGSRMDGFIQFVDLAPTVLNLAGIPVPDEMDGRPFMGEGVTREGLEQRDVAFSHADRFDEKIDFVRAIRKGRYKYIRHYQPFNVDGLQNNYRYRMLAYREWREMYKAGELTPEQAQFFEPRAPEALYDLEEDPFELVNLAGRKAYHGVLEEMRGLLLKQVSGMPDLGFIPEPVLVRSAADNPAAYGQAQKMRIRQLAGIADLGLKSFREARGGIDRGLSSSDPLKRYWAWIVVRGLGRRLMHISMRHALRLWPIPTFSSECGRRNFLASPDWMIPARSSWAVSNRPLQSRRPASS